MNTKHKLEFGDFQTPLELSRKIVDFIATIFPIPNIIVEPNSGIGNFLKAALLHWNNQCSYFGFDINKKYIDNLSNDLTINNCYFEVSDFFSKDWEFFFSTYKDQNILVIGNPPWVTNSALSSINSNNLPSKSNFQKFNGLEAKLGKANFDIAEWMLINLINSLQKYNACIAMICKTSTARKVLKYFWRKDANIYNSSIHLIDAKNYFNVSVDACLLIVHMNLHKKSNQANVYTDLSFETKTYSFGLVNNELIANLDDFYQYHEIDGICQYKWRSGVKHDAAKVMELTYNNRNYINGFGEILDIEDEYIYPLLKSSDLSNHRFNSHRFLIVTHDQSGNSIKTIKYKAPKTWIYLQKYGHILDSRKSIIYQKRPQFSMFGIGDYSFTPWKVAISGFYKNITFSSIGNVNKKPIMLDDTCYFISCYSKEEADFISESLNSQPCQKFLKSLIFFDSKRPVNIEILSRIDLKKLAEINHSSQKMDKYLPKLAKSFVQSSLVFNLVN